jgi:hypothetical protein
MNLTSTNPIGNTLNKLLEDNDVNYGHYCNNTIKHK